MQKNPAVGLYECHERLNDGFNDVRGTSQEQMSPSKGKEAGHKDQSGNIKSGGNLSKSKKEN